MFDFTKKTGSILLLALGLLMGFSNLSFAHCDTMEGPVIASARKALETGNIDNVLMWVSQENENEIRTVFDNVMQVRDLDPQVRELADRYFFETLVRIHREGEGAPYTGLKSGVEIDHAVQLADEAMVSGSVDELVTVLTNAIEKKIRQQFQHVQEAKKNADSSVSAGREYVEAYVTYTHFAEGLHSIIQGHSEHEEH